MNRKQYTNPFNRKGGVTHLFLHERPENTHMYAPRDFLPPLLFTQEANETLPVTLVPLSALDGATELSKGSRPESWIPRQTKVLLHTKSSPHKEKRGHSGGLSTLNFATLRIFFLNHHLFRKKIFTIKKTCDQNSSV